MKAKLLATDSINYYSDQHNLPHDLITSDNTNKLKNVAKKAATFCDTTRSNIDPSS